MKHTSEISLASHKSRTNISVNPQKVASPLGKQENRCILQTFGAQGQATTAVYEINSERNKVIVLFVGHKKKSIRSLLKAPLKTRFSLCF